MKALKWAARFGAEPCRRGSSLSELPALCFVPLPHQVPHHDHQPLPPWDQMSTDAPMLFSYPSETCSGREPDVFSDAVGQTPDNCSGFPFLLEDKPQGLKA